ncbi:MAG TPA: nuclear transport factor 2 family protein [Nocardia sp.]|uniref:nuclear transport factor 2 family protein n=1 Tax=Nocardia sp. TaxID=1821 RepID=UPI002B4B0855|nr:nuclear transport factor 2 family protein [Nocardia sp.]HLS77784.1 nuclear transport factor 2 family protein [Nocardia sp.]
MPTEPAAADLLAAVQASPRAVAAHDKPAWVGLFAADAEVNDPVGSAPHIGAEAIGRFYDTFIAPNRIAFHVERDAVAGSTVVRDLAIEITMSTGATVTVPMHLRYDLHAGTEGSAETAGSAGAGELRIARLAAHWELAPMMGRLLATGLSGLGAATVLGARLLRNQGPAGALGMTRALAGVGRAGKTVARRLFAAAAETDLAGVRELVGDRADITVAGRAVSVEEFTNRARDMRWDKMLAAGRWVTTSVTVGSAHGVAMIEFTPRSLHIARLELFLDQP